MPNLPKAAAQWKVLPALVNSLEYGGGSARALEPLLKIASVLNEEEYVASFAWNSFTAPPLLPSL